ncbi:ABC transporter permease [Arsenicitalea aurantiaca]|uniref:ABC transporter permease n=2 Tax=Arsenicitalea aurantiaca TaxID=1783274 RepID=A0A433X8R7_9HYPH|nr:ABC transporter permease [Arsenicitalea aurantiaca]
MGAPGGLAPLAIFSALAALSLLRFAHPLPLLADGALAIFGLAVILFTLGPAMPAPFWAGLVAVWLATWLLVDRLSLEIALRRLPEQPFALIIPLLFGVVLLVGWEAITRGAGVPSVILPAPSAIWARILTSTGTLWADLQQTFKAVLAGYAIGCGLGFVLAIAIDRSGFLKRGLLPLGSFVSALPIIGIAPIMVMWFGFDWPSKAAVVAVMTFFPMLVNSVAGLGAAGAMERDLLSSYAADYWQTLMKLRLPAAGPFIFNALKINSTLALIGAIVAEFFGSPVVGMGFRISSEVGRMNVDMVWAEIAMAALAGSAFYGVIALIERAVTFWHPSVRGA